MVSSLCDVMSWVGSHFLLSADRMDTTEQCNAVISHFNGKFIKTASGALGKKEMKLCVSLSCRLKTLMSVVWLKGVFFCASPPAPSQPLLCKFADSQRKKHSHSGYVPNGQTGDLRLVCICQSSYNGASCPRVLFFNVMMIKFFLMWDANNYD